MFQLLAKMYQGNIPVLFKLFAWRHIVHRATCFKGDVFGGTYSASAEGRACNLNEATKCEPLACPRRPAAAAAAARSLPLDLQRS